MLGGEGERGEPLGKPGGGVRPHLRQEEGGRAGAARAASRSPPRGAIAFPLHGANVVPMTSSRNE